MFEYMMLANVNMYYIGLAYWTQVVTGNKKYLNGKVTIITGGGSGLGEAACRLFAENGAIVVVADYNFEEAIRVHTDIYKSGHESIPCHVNVANRESVDKLVADIIRTYGRIDILINNAGITRDSTVVKMQQEQWDQVIATNLTGVYNCISATVPHMIEQGSGSIINTSSVVGTSGGFGQVNYSATKAGVIGMTKSLAKELGKKGIRVNAVAPGFILTPMVKKMPEKVIKMMEEKIPMGRLGEPIEVAGIYLFLASDLSSYVNGTVLEVDGGIMF
jgi:3-oxoacyl-[acyl-carrier protein] reductase